MVAEAFGVPGTFGFVMVGCVVCIPLAAVTELDRQRAGAIDRKGALRRSMAAMAAFDRRRRWGGRVRPDLIEEEGRR